MAARRRQTGSAKRNVQNVIRSVKKDPRLAEVRKRADAARKEAAKRVDQVKKDPRVADAQKRADAARKQAAKKVKTNPTLTNVQRRAQKALSKRASGVATRARTAASEPLTRAQLYEMAKQRDIPGRSTMTRDELARALGEK